MAVQLRELRSTRNRPRRWPSLRRAVRAAALGVLAAVPRRKWGVMFLYFKCIEYIKELRRRAAASPRAVARRLSAARQLRVRSLVVGFVKKLLLRASARLR